MRRVRAIGGYEVSIGVGRSPRSAGGTILLESKLAEGAARSARQLREEAAATRVMVRPAVAESVGVRRLRTVSMISARKGSPRERREDKSDPSSGLYWMP
jgi:hypothetical protein